MRWEDRILEAATVAAREAVQRERGRCLWVLSQVIEELEFELSRKLLMESERHTIEVKLRIARAVVAKAKRGIVAGLRPKADARPKAPTAFPSEGKVSDEVSPPDGDRPSDDRSDGLSPG